MRISVSRKLLAVVAAIGLISVVGAVGAARAPAGPSATRPRVAATKAHGASTPTRYGVEIQAVYDVAGNPSLVANFSPDGGLATPRWSVCSPPDLRVCRPARRAGQPSAPAGHASQFLDAGPTPAGTIFQATADYRGQTYVARTAPWLGTVGAIVGPKLEGRPRYGTAVNPHAASWTGGWQPDPTFNPQAGGGDSGGHGPDFDFLSVEACRTPDARHCVNLSAPASYGYGFSKRPPVVGAWFTGWYLFAIDQRLAHDTAFAEPGYRTPAAVPAVKLGATAAHSAPLGPVIGPKPPRVLILRNAILRDGQVLVARLRCSVRCRTFLQVDDNNTGSDAHLSLTGSGLVGIPRKQLHPGSLNVQIYVDSGPLVHGKTRLR